MESIKKNDKDKKIDKLIEQRNNKITALKKILSAFNDSKKEESNNKPKK